MRISDWSSDVCSSDLFLAQRQLLYLLPLPADQACSEVLAILLHFGGYRPIFLGLEGFDFAFALDDKAERHRLHPTSRFCSGKFAPKNRRQGEANQIIERTASAIGIDQIGRAHV